MIIDYKIDENIFLMHQLFRVSKNNRVRKRRLQTKLLLSLIFIVPALLFLLMASYTISIVFFAFAILWFVIFPMWERQHYIKHYLSYINRDYKDRFGKTVTFEFGKEFILAKDHSSEGKIPTSELEEINEIPLTIFIRLKDGATLILPKEKIANVDKLIIGLKDLANHLKIKYNVDEKWKWR